MEDLRQVGRAQAGKDLQIEEMKPSEDFDETPNEIAGANAGLRIGFVEKSRVVLSFWPGVARLDRSKSAFACLLAACSGRCGVVG